MSPDPLRSIAAHYADDPDEVDYIAALAAERLAARLRRSGVACVVCGTRFVPTHRDATLCSDACEQRQRRQKRAGKSALS